MAEIPDPKRKPRTARRGVKARGRPIATSKTTGVAGGRALRSRRLVKTSELIARDIILDISERDLKAGDLLASEAAMMQDYEVGRSSLREALRLLEVQGLIQIRAGPNGGPVVGAATAENLARMLTLFFGLAGATYEDLTKVMLLIDPVVAEVAASTPHSPEDIALLESSLEKACGPPRPKQLRTEALMDFHQVIGALGQNSIWSLLAGAINLIFADHVIAAVDSRAFHATAIEDHNQIADAILAGDVTLTKARMKGHTERMIEFYRSQNPSVFNRLIEWR